MVNSIKKNFSIKDLENLSGIKAHTIRIWEKRYNLLAPSRTDTNIRYYSLQSLQKLLNIALLYNNGYKISKISSIPENQLPLLVKEMTNKLNGHDRSLSDFKLAMVNFDQKLFYATYNHLLANKTFREIFYDVFIPLLHELGLLWQTNTITPAHEHFISGLIKQKILVNTEKVFTSATDTNDQVFVLYLPENEIHEIGLLYLNYEIVLRGYHTIYLGQSVPLDALKDIQTYYPNLTYISYFTVEPTPDKLPEYLEDFQLKINPAGNIRLWLLGRQLDHLDQKNKFPQLKVFKSIAEVVAEL